MFLFIGSIISKYFIDFAKKFMIDESLLKFPTNYPIKIIGSNTEIFFEDIFKILLEIDPNLNKDNIEKKNSTSKKYISISCEILLESKEQLESFYKKVNSHPDLKIAL